MKYYFIDFENVHSDGFYGMEQVNKGDVIYVIYSERSKVFSLEIVEKAAIQGAELKAYKVEVGSKNALDFQLSSFLGYIIGKCDDIDCSYAIVSKDMGYDKVVSFWKNRGRKIQRIVNLSGKETLSNLPALVPSEKKQEEKRILADVQPPAKVAPCKEAEQETSMQTEPKNEQKTKQQPHAQKTAAKSTQISKNSQTKKKCITKATEEEVRRLLSSEEYSDTILGIINKFKTKQAISNGLSKELRDSKKAGSIYKKLKPLLKEKKKT